MEGHVIAQLQLFRLAFSTFNTHCVSSSKGSGVGQHGMCFNKHVLGSPLYSEVTDDQGAKQGNDIIAKPRLARA